MVKRLMKQPMFLTGCIFVFGLFISSILYMIIWHDHIPVKEFVYSKSGQLVTASPLSPFYAPPLGTDSRGNNLGVMILIGAKYTIGVALIITFLRMLLSAVLGWAYGMYFYRFRSIVTGLFEGIHYIPMTLLSAVILMPVLRPNVMTAVFKYSQTTREVGEILILAIIGVPVVMIQIGGMIGEIRQRPFIDSARVLGAGSWQIFWHEIRPHFLPQFGLICVQQIIQVMILLVDLGVLGLFFGGTLVEAKGNELYSATNEWSGLAGLYRDQYWAGSPWLFLVPIVTFTLTILAFSFILEGLKRTMMQEEAKSQNKEEPEEANNIEKDDKKSLCFKMMNSNHPNYR